MNANIIPKMLQYVQVSSVLGKRALDELAKKQAAEKRAADQIPALTDILVQAGVINADQKQAAAQMLGDHASTQALLKTAVSCITKLKTASTKTAGDIGQGVSDPTKQGAARADDWSLTSPFCGQRTSEKKASDLALERGLGLSV